VNKKDAFLKSITTQARHIDFFNLLMKTLVCYSKMVISK